MAKDKKKLNLFDLVSVGVGSMIGSGIFAMLGTGITHAGRAVPLALALAAIVVSLQYARMIALSAVFVLPGGKYDQSALVLPPALTGMDSLTYLTSCFSISVVAISIASYVVQLIPATAPYETLVAVLVTTFFFATAIPGSKFMARIQNIMTVMLYIALALFIIYGLLNWNPNVTSEPFLPEGGTGLLVATALMTYTCNGATNPIGLTADAEDPKKNVPKSIIIATLIGLAFYALLGFAATSALPYSEISGQNLGYIAQQIMPSGVYIYFIVGGAIFALTTTLLGTVAVLNPPIVSAANDGWLPKIFAKKTKGGFAWFTMLVMYLLTVVPIIGGFSLDFVLSLIMVPNAIITFVTVFFCWNVPKRFPKTWAANSWHMSETVWHILMVLSLIASLIVTVYSLYGQSITAILSNAAMTAALFAFGFFRYKSGKVRLNAREVYTE